jgi:hypothetical protein
MANISLHLAAPLLILSGLMLVAALLIWRRPATFVDQSDESSSLPRTSTIAEDAARQIH